MSSSTALASGQPLVNSVDCLLADRRERWRTAGLWAVEAMDAARSHVMNMTEAVITMDMDKAQYHREVRGIGHFSLLRLGMMPESFWRAFVHELSVRFKWDLAVVQPVTREETPEEELNRNFVAMAQSFMVVRRYAKKGAGL